MEINITKKEYEALLDMLYVADWVIHACAIKKAKQHEYEALKQKFLSYFKEMDASDKIEFSSDLNEYFETAEYEKSLNDTLIEPFEHELFWDELIQKLGERDVIRTIGVEQYRRMNFIDRMKKVEEVKKQYAQEFDKHGLEHLKIES